MTTLAINDLPLDCSMDREARRAARGGFLGFLAGLPLAPTGYTPSANWNVTQNIFVNNTTNVFQQNPLNVSISAGDGGIVSMGDFSPMLLSAGSPMTFVQGGLG